MDPGVPGGGLPPGAKAGFTKAPQEGAQGGSGDPERRRHVGATLGGQKSYPIQKPKSQPLLVVAKSVYFVQSKCIG